MFDKLKVPILGLVDNMSFFQGIDGKKYNIFGEGGVENMVATRDAQCPMNKMGDAWDVAYAALFLASDEAKYVTGTQLVVDGGISCQIH